MEVVEGGKGKVEEKAIEPAKDNRPAAPGGSGFLAMRPADALAIIREFKVFMQEVMEENVDYGKVPGVDKPFLWKSGAIWVLKLHGYSHEATVDWDHSIEDFGNDESPAEFSYHVRVQIHSLSDGKLLGTGLGHCSSHESKYAWRMAKWTCPKCGKQEIIKGREEYGGGYVCWKNERRGAKGCGAKFSDSDKAITGQKVGRIPNPDLCDLANTILKMAEKRAITDGALNVTAANRWFTQDEESLRAQGDLEPAKARFLSDDEYEVRDAESARPAQGEGGEPRGRPAAAPPPTDSGAAAATTADTVTGHAGPRAAAPAISQHERALASGANPPNGVARGDPKPEPPAADQGPTVVTEEKTLPSKDDFNLLREHCNRWKLHIERMTNGKPDPEGRWHVQFPLCVFKALKAPIPRSPNDAWVELRTLGKRSVDIVNATLNDPRNLKLREEELEHADETDDVPFGA